MLNIQNVYCPKFGQHTFYENKSDIPNVYCPKAG